MAFFPLPFSPFIAQSFAREACRSEGRTGESISLLGLHCSLILVQGSDAFISILFIFYHKSFTLLFPKWVAAKVGQREIVIVLALAVLKYSCREMTCIYFFLHSYPFLSPDVYYFVSEACRSECRAGSDHSHLHLSCRPMEGKDDYSPQGFKGRRNKWLRNRTNRIHAALLLFPSLAMVVTSHLSFVFFLLSSVSLRPLFLLTIPLCFLSCLSLPFFSAVFYSFSSSFSSFRPVPIFFFILPFHPHSLFSFVFLSLLFLVSFLFCSSITLFIPFLPFLLLFITLFLSYFSCACFSSSHSCFITTTTNYLLHASSASSSSSHSSCTYLSFFHSFFLLFFFPFLIFHWLIFSPSPPAPQFLYHLSSLPPLLYHRYHHTSSLFFLPFPILLLFLSSIFSIFLSLSLSPPIYLTFLFLL